MLQKDSILAINYKHSKKIKNEKVYDINSIHIVLYVLTVVLNAILSFVCNVIIIAENAIKLYNSIILSLYYVFSDPLLTTVLIRKKFNNLI